MRELRRQLWHRLTSRQLRTLTLVAGLDSALLIALGYAILVGESALILLLAPSYSTLFLVLAGSLFGLAGRGRASWALVTLIVVLGPLGALIGLRILPPRSSP